MKGCGYKSIESHGRNLPQTCQVDGVGKFEGDQLCQDDGVDSADRVQKTNIWQAQLDIVPL